MMLVAVVSVKGSPGVSTFAFALATSWPEEDRRLLVEADPSGGDLAPRLSLPGSPGLVSLAAARHDPDPALIWRHTQTLPGGVALIAGPPGAEQARAALRTLTTPPAGDPLAVHGITTRDADTVVVADCGRIGPGSPAMPIIEAADVTLLLTRAHAEDLTHLAACLPTLGGWTSRPALLLVGDGYRAAEVAHELRVPVMAHIPEDRVGVAVLYGCRPGRRPLGRHRLGRAAHHVAASLRGHHHQGEAAPHPTDPATPAAGLPSSGTEPISPSEAGS